MDETGIAGAALSDRSSAFRSNIISMQVNRAFANVIDSSDYGMVKIRHQFVLRNAAGRLRLDKSN